MPNIKCISENNGLC